MSDAGSTRFPEAPRFTSALQSGGNRDDSRNILQITSLRDEQGRTISNKGDKPIRIEGEILNAAQDGKVRIKTQSGTLEADIAPQDGKARMVPIQAGQKIEINIAPDRERNASGDATSAQIRIKETRIAPNKPSTSEPSAEKPAQTIPYAPRPDSYTPPAKAPEQRTPTEIARDLAGIPVRLDPVPPAQQQILQTALLNTPPALILPTALTSQIQSLAHSIPAQITSEQMTALLQTPPPPATHSTTSGKNQFFVVNQDITGIISGNSAAHSSTGMPANTAESSIISGKLAQNTNIFKQPIDIRSNFLFLSSDVIKLSSLSMAPLSGNAPAPTANAQPVITRPATMIFSGLQLPAVTLHAITAPPIPAATVTPESGTGTETWTEPDADSDKTAPFIKADPFSKTDMLLTQNAIGRLSATVQAITQHNQPVVTFSDPSLNITGSQSFILQAPLGGLPAGSLIELIPQNPSGSLAQGVQGNTPAHTPNTLSLMPMMPEKWPLLDNIMHILNGAGNHAGAATGSAQLSGIMLPSPGSPAQMGAMALFVIAALRAGDLSQILSERSQNTLRIAGKGGLLSQLTQEGQTIARAGAEPPSSQDWRSLTLPMLWENEVNKVILHYKHDNGGDNEGAQEKGKQTRFIFDLDLSRMGKVQLDGLFREKRMDLILRTHEPFSRAMQLHIQNGYSNAMELTGLSGDISFQNDPRSWINVKTVDTGQFKSNI